MKWLLIGCIAGFLFGIVLNLPKLVGLGLPVLYSLVIVWVPSWSTAHPVLSNGIFYGLIRFNVLLWLISFGQFVYDRIVERCIQQREIAAIIKKLKEKGAVKKLERESLRLFSCADKDGKRIVFRQERIAPPTLRIGKSFWLRSGFEFLKVVVVFVEVVADRNEKKLGSDKIKASSSRSSVIAVLLHDHEGAFRLDGSAPSQQSTVDGIQVLEHLLMDLR